MNFREDYTSFHGYNSLNQIPTTIFPFIADSYTRTPSDLQKSATYPSKYRTHEQMLTSGATPISGPRLMNFTTGLFDPMFQSHRHDSSIPILAFKNLNELSNYSVHRSDHPGRGKTATSIPFSIEAILGLNSSRKHYRDVICDFSESDSDSVKPAISPSRDFITLHKTTPVSPDSTATGYNNVGTAGLKSNRTQYDGSFMNGKRKADNCNENKHAKSIKLEKTGSASSPRDHSLAHGRQKSPKPKRVRTIFTSEQLERLEAEFEEQQYMVGPERQHLAYALNLTEAQVKVWFQNRRIKSRKQHSEIVQAKLRNLEMENNDQDSDGTYNEDEMFSSPGAQEETDSLSTVNLEH